MPRYDTYFLMKEADVIDYVQTKYPGHFDKDAVLTVKEIGDGNLNYVFRVVEEKTGKSIIVKQAGEALRISADMKVSTDRNRIESEILQIQDKYAPGLVPKIYGYDTVMCACAMEDLSDHALMRYALMRHETFPRFAEDISTYMVNTLLKTTDVAMEHKEKKAMVKSFINPELCEITEDLVLTEPYNDCNHRNNVFPPIADFVRRELYEDNALKLAVAKLKFEFMNNAQSLIHGDLHTGSIFVKQDSTRVFDPEFAFYGPMGYDIGNVVANLIFAWDNGRAAGADEFCDWALKTIEETVDLFCEKFLKCFDECDRPHGQDPRLQGELSGFRPVRHRRLCRHRADPPHGGHGQRQGRNHHRRRGQARPCREGQHPLRQGLHHEPHGLQDRRRFRRRRQACR